VDYVSKGYATQIDQLTGKVGCVCNHLRTRPGAARTTISRSSPAPTNSGINDHRVIVEIVSNIARRRTPKACWRAPICGRGRLVGDIRRDVGAGKVPQGHAGRRVPQKRKDTALSSVKPITKRTRGGVEDRASCVGTLCAIAIRVEDLTSERVLGVEGAGVRRPTVERHLIVWLIVDALHDIDLSGQRPVRPIGLQSTAIQPCGSSKLLGINDEPKSWAMCHNQPALQPHPR
jgi:hypothetical protein